MSVPKVNHGPCRVCRGPIIYLGALFCSPQCWMRWAERGDEQPPTSEVEVEVEVEVVKEIEEAPSEPAPSEPAPSEPAPSEPAPAAPMSFLESPPDEPPKRRVYL